MTPISSILRQATRKYNEPLNIICGATHERLSESFARTGHRFIMVDHSSFKKWDASYAPIPPNHIQLRGSDDILSQIPFDVSIDLFLAQNRYSQCQIFRQLAQQLHVPLITYELTYPTEQIKQQLEAIRHGTEGDFNVFLTEASMQAWGGERYKNNVVIEHGINTELFKPRGQRQPVIMHCCNDFVNRGYICGLDIWQTATAGLPVKIFGNTPGLSKAAASPEHLAEEYASAAIYFNTTRESPISTSMLEAMASGCAIVSTATCNIPNVIQHGVNGLLSNDVSELRSYVQQCLADPALCQRLGTAARQTILERYSVDRFVKNWNSVFNAVREFVYKG